MKKAVASVDCKCLGARNQPENKWVNENMRFDFVNNTATNGQLGAAVHDINVLIESKE